MEFFNIELAVIAVFLGLLFFFSLVESAVIQASPILLRMILEQDDGAAPSFGVLENRNQVFVPLQFGTSSAPSPSWYSPPTSAWSSGPVMDDYAFLANIVLGAVSACCLDSSQNGSEEKLVALRGCQPSARVLGPVALPLSHVLRLHKRMQEVRGERTTTRPPKIRRTKSGTGVSGEDSRLIQSVVEFGDTLVRK